MNRSLIVALATPPKYRALVSLQAIDGSLAAIRSSYHDGHSLDDSRCRLHLRLAEDLREHLRRALAEQDR